MANRSHALLGAACLVAGAFAGEARADWQYTRWGMTPEQVAAASQGAVQAGATPADKRYDGVTGGALGTFQGDGATFDAYFHFDTNRLAKVALEHTGGTPCPVVHSALEARHGKPNRLSKESFATIDQWRDAGRGNLVSYVKIGDSPCTITYERLPSR